MGRSERRNEPKDVSVHKLYKMLTVLFKFPWLDLWSHMLCKWICKTTYLIQHCDGSWRVQSQHPGKYNLGYNCTLLLISHIHFDLLLTVEICVFVSGHIAVYNKCPGVSQSVKHVVRCSSIQTRVTTTEIKKCYLVQRNWKHTIFRHRPQAMEMQGVGIRCRDSRAKSARYVQSA